MESKPIIFQSVFGADWEGIPLVIRQHYANRAHSNDVSTIEGITEIRLSWLAKLCSPLMRWTGTLVPYSGQAIPTTVRLESEPDSGAMIVNRSYNFPERNYCFRSRMLPIGGNEMVEYMPIGIGWHARYRAEGNKILVEHCGYRGKIFGRSFRLPLEALLGEMFACEEALSENSFRMYMEIHHRIFGRLYMHRGEFSLSRKQVLDAQNQGED